MSLSVSLVIHCKILPFPLMSGVTNYLQNFSINIRGTTDWKNLHPFYFLFVQLLIAKQVTQFCKTTYTHNTYWAPASYFGCLSVFVGLTSFFKHWFYYYCLTKKKKSCIKDSRHHFLHPSSSCSVCFSCAGYFYWFVVERLEPIFSITWRSLVTYRTLASAVKSQAHRHFEVCILRGNDAINIINLCVM